MGQYKDKNRNRLPVCVYPRSRTDKKTHLENACATLSVKMIKEGNLPFMEPIEPITNERIELASDWEPTPENLNAIHDLAITGATEQAIASIALKVTDDVYFQLRDKYPQINQTINTARRQGEAIAAVEYFNEMCIRGAKNRVASLQFYLKNRANWSEAIGQPLPVLPKSEKEIKSMSNEQLALMLRHAITDQLDEDEE